MNILYFGIITDEKVYKEYETFKQPTTVAQSSFEKSFYSEVKKNKAINVKAISMFQVKTFPSYSLLVNKNHKDSDINYIPYINLPFIKELMVSFYCAFQIIKWYLIQSNKKENYILSSIYYLPIALPTIIISKLFRIKNIICFTDLPLYIYSDERLADIPFYKKIIIRPYLRLLKSLEKEYSAYILFSKPMDEVVNRKNKPNIVIEGIYKSNNYQNTKIEKNRKVIAYAGTLNKEYGITNIIDVFQKINDTEAELWLFGNGNQRDFIENEAENNSKIKFFGFRPKEEVFSFLQKASLLVNLRDPEDIYTKYSFPSKMFEYMASGTPVFTTRLDGIPQDYYEYVYSIDELNLEKISQEIYKIINQDVQKLNDFGEKAKKYVINNKNQSKQVSKIISFMEKI